MIYLCTAITFNTEQNERFFGRTLDFSLSISPSLYLISKHYEWCSSLSQKIYTDQYSFMGIGQEIHQSVAFFEGVNEKGLALAALYFEGYADFKLSTNSEEELSTFDFVHYLLGSCSSIKEIKKTLSDKRIVGLVDPITNTVAPFHWIAVDRSGACIVIEQTINGLEILDNPIGVLTNSPTFSWHLTNLRNYMNLTTKQLDQATWDQVVLKPFSQGGGTTNLPGSFTSPERFVRAAFLKTHIETPKTSDEAILSGYHILNNVFIPKGIVITPEGNVDYTKYVSMMNITTGEYYYKTYNNDQIMTASLHSFQLDEPKAICLGALL